MEKELVCIRGYYVFKPSDKALKTPTSAQANVTLAVKARYLWHDDILTDNSYLNTDEEVWGCPKLCPVR